MIDIKDYVYNLTDEKLEELLYWACAESRGGSAPKDIFINVLSGVLDIPTQNLIINYFEDQIEVYKNSTSQVTPSYSEQMMFYKELIELTFELQYHNSSKLNQIDKVVLDRIYFILAFIITD